MLNRIQCMDDLRYLLRVLRSVGRVIRRRVQQAWRARKVQKLIPLFVGGFLLGLFSRWLLPQPAREFLPQILVGLLVAVVSFYVGALDLEQATRVAARAPLGFP